jgi:hypothetical protein
VTGAGALEHAASTALDRAAYAATPAA